MLGVAGAFVGGALALGLVTPAFALDAPVEPAEMPSARTASTAFTPDLQTEIHIADDSMPNDFVSSADGTTGYVTSRGLNEFTIIDMQTRTVSARIATPGTGGDDIRLRHGDSDHHKHGALKPLERVLVVAQPAVGDLELSQWRIGVAGTKEIPGEGSSPFFLIR